MNEDTNEDMDDIFIDNEESDDIEDTEEESKEDDSEIKNETITPQEIVSLLSMGYNQHNETVYGGQIRRRENESPLQTNKFFKNISGKRILKERLPSYSYLCLKSGEEFYFKEEDGINILLNDRLEPNRLIRNIISRIPVRVIERMEFLAKFVSDENINKDDENSEKIQKRYLGNLKELVYEGYIKEWRLRFLFKRLLVLWRVYKMNNKCEKEVDPITLSEPEKEIYLYDWANKKKFIFDAKSLAIMIESKLMYQEYGFATPMYPRNPKNNVEFSYEQLVSLYFQLKEQGELKWGLTTLREYNFNKNRWQMYHKSALTMNAIKVNLFLLDTEEARELLSDFIFAKMEELLFTYNTYIYNCYQIAIVKVPTHWYLEKFKSLAILHYEAVHFGHNRNKIINSLFIKFLKKQSKFINDLKSKNII
jgi:hypothetical protein